ncbi:MAG: elongation factor P [Candidatus Omnitrophota bacterium]|nr:elongation factor P [Candidatus Omnitrophota bacterium]MDZ4241750.1 elongation factor P [Candidatus Omnitrophota bacterium]
MSITINEIESGIGLLIDDQIYMVLDYQHVKPGKGSAFVRVRMKNLKTSSVIERTFRSAEKLDDIPLDEKRLEFLYRSGDEFHFMDHESYEQMVVPHELLGDNDRFLLENLQVTGLFHEHRVLKVILPNFITTEIVGTETGVRGDSTRAGTKPATIQTGASIQVPLFINIGDRIKIDTRTGDYVERVQR